MSDGNEERKLIALGMKNRLTVRQEELDATEPTACERCQRLCSAWTEPGLVPD
jgi:hypothetical protein